MSTQDDARSSDARFTCAQCGATGPTTAAIQHKRSCETYGRWYSAPCPNEARYGEQPNGEYESRSTAAVPSGRCCCSWTSAEATDLERRESLRPCEMHRKWAAEQRTDKASSTPSGLGHAMRVLIQAVANGTMPVEAAWISVMREIDPPPYNAQTDKATSDWERAYKFMAEFPQGTRFDQAMIATLISEVRAEQRVDYVQGGPPLDSKHPWAKVVSLAVRLVDGAPAAGLAVPDLTTAVREMQRAAYGEKLVIFGPDPDSAKAKGS